MPADPGIADLTPADGPGVAGAAGGLADVLPAEFVGGSGAVDGIADAPPQDGRGESGAVGGLADATEETYIAGNLPPIIPAWGPTGSPEIPAVPVGFACDDDNPFLTTGLYLTLTPPGAPPVPVLVAGLWQVGYGGLFAPYGANGYLVACTAHAPFAPGVWSATASVTDAGGLAVTQTWQWTSGIAPTISGETPTGAAELANVAVGVDCDDDAPIPAGHLGLVFIPPAGPPVAALTAGVWQPGYGGTIVALGNGFQVRCTTHPLFAAGAWQAQASVVDSGGLVTTSTWGWTVANVPPTQPRKWPSADELTGERPVIGFGVEDAVGMNLTSFNLTLACVTEQRRLVVSGVVNPAEFEGAIWANAGHGYDCQGRPARDLPNRKWFLRLDAENLTGVPLP